MTISTLLCFLGASIVFTLAPGPDTAFVLAQGISRGRRAAIITALGMCSGVSVHTTAAAFGISAALYASATAFAILKYTGAAYLLFLAYKALKASPSASQQPVVGIVADAQPWAAHFRRGFLMNVVNPKVGLFFLAFLPQFVTRDGGSFAQQMVVLGAVFMLQAVFVMSMIGYLSGSLGDALLKRPGVARCLTWLTAGVFGALGLKLALAQR